MNVLVTGGGGFLGTEIIKQLKDKGHAVTSVSRNQYPHLANLGVKSIQADLSKEAMDLSDYEAVIHTAAKAGVWGKYDEYYQSNYVATEKLVDQAKKDGVKYFIYTSSPSVVFGKEDIENGDESLDYPKKFYAHYAKTKALAEKYTLEASTSEFQTVAIRPHLIWGEGDPHIVPRLIMKARSGKLKRVGDGENLVDVTHVKNAALAHILALEALASGKELGGNSYFIGQERPVNLWSFIDDILVRAGAEMVNDSVSFKTAYSAGLVFEKLFGMAGISSPEPPITRFVALQFAKSHYFSHDKAQRDFGYSPVVSIEEGLSQLFEGKRERRKVVDQG